MKYGISTQLIHLDDPDNQIPLWDEIAQREGYFSTSPFFFLFYFLFLWLNPQPQGCDSEHLPLCHRLLSMSTQSLHHISSQECSLTNTGNGHSLNENDGMLFSKQKRWNVITLTHEYMPSESSPSFPRLYLLTIIGLHWYYF